MNRNLIIGIILVVVVGLGYYQFSMKPAQEAAQQAATATAEATKAAADAAAATTQAAADAAAATTKAAADAAAATTAAATDAAAATTAAATTAASAVTDAAAAVLDPANWDMAKVNAMIAATPLDDTMKKTLTDAVTAAAADPAKITAVIAQIKTALGM